MSKTISRIPVKLTLQGEGEAEGEFIRHLSPRTVDALLRALPLEGRVALWKNEVYFEVAPRIGEEKSKDSVKKGTMAYWPMGRAVCVFYEEARPYSPVNLVGQITSNLGIFSQVRSGTKIRIEKIQTNLSLGRIRISNATRV